MKNLKVYQRITNNGINYTAISVLDGDLLKGGKCLMSVYLNASNEEIAFFHNKTQKLFIKLVEVRHDVVESAKLHDKKNRKLAFQLKRQFGGNVEVLNESDYNIKREELSF